MSNTPSGQTAIGKKPLDPHLMISDRGTVDDVRVQSGYPIWNLIGAWLTAGHNDEEILSGYGISQEEWEAAKRYYFDRKPIIDARIITNSQPAADDDVPPMRTAEEYFVWLLRDVAPAEQSEMRSNG